MADPRVGQVREIGPDHVRSAHPLNLFRRGPIKAEVAGEWIDHREGRKVRAYWGRDQDGEWRGRIEDIGHANESSPYAFIRVLGDEQISMDAVHYWSQEQADRFLKACESDHQDYEDESYRALLIEYMERVLAAKKQMRANVNKALETLGIKTDQDKARAWAAIRKEQARQRRGMAGL